MSVSQVIEENFALGSVLAMAPIDLEIINQFESDEDKPTAMLCLCLRRLGQLSVDALDLKAELKAIKSAIS